MSTSAAESQALKVAAGVAAAGALAYAALRAASRAAAPPPPRAAPDGCPTLRRTPTAKSDADYIPVGDASGSSESEPDAAASPATPPISCCSDAGGEEHKPLGRERSYRSKFSCCDTKLQGRFMDAAVHEARTGLAIGEGGPFGACITRKGKVVAQAHNMVLQTNDPTAHAEVTCIRKAAARLGRFDLSDCVLYTSCEPCPMCFGAIHWAKIPVCVYAADRGDAAKAGFDDAFIYDAIKGTADEEHVKMVHQPHAGAVDVFSAKFDQY